ncbi:MAG: tRNA (adenosine(37)-N6)-threonylcarbamoyltransferase complex dimerization subunit type 1 TsaB [Pelagimonas sp.]|uniref:tRNA (adenosine(37)-N6)-threonylcarbamoyltransferase complex dimerization subunit type 1 TsaB n=1 Tax=Pelagimonas sp. TaxID=2073170 RepID=UPI003D6BA886
MTHAPLILGFDTSGPCCTAALLRGDILVASQTQDMARGQAERIMPLIQEVLIAGNVDFSNLDAIGVGIGPGNFTGIRISVSAARGLALALDIPAIGVSQFQALALGVDGPVVCSVAAPRDRLYVQTLNDNSASAAALCDLDTLRLPNPKAEAAAIGVHADEIAKRTGGRVLTAKYPPAEAIARQALCNMHNANLTPPAPLYLRPADAAPSRNAPPVILADPSA